MKRRTSFSFSSEAMAQIRALLDRTHVADASELIRSALNAYSELVSLAGAGNHMYVRDGAGSKWPYSPYIKLTYPGLRRDEFNAQAREAAKTIKAETFFFSGEIIQKIESLKKRSHLSSNIEAIRVALSAFKELVLVLEAGDVFVVREASGCELPFNPFLPFKSLTSSVSDVEEKDELTDA